MNIIILLETVKIISLFSESHFQVDTCKLLTIYRTIKEELLLEKKYCLFRVVAQRQLSSHVHIAGGWVEDQGRDSQKIVTSDVNTWI